VVYSQEKHLHFVKQILFENYVEYVFDESLRIWSSVWKVHISLLKSRNFSGNTLCSRRLAAS